MNLEQKQKMVVDLEGHFGSSSAAFLVNYKGCTCEELTRLKRKLAPAGAKMAVVKNTLAKRAVSGSKNSVVSDLFKGPTAVVWASKDPVQPAKILAEFAKEKETFELKGGVMDGAHLSPAQVTELATLPSKEQVLSKLLALINAPATQLLRTINAPAASLARLLEAWRGEIEKKQS